MSKLAKKDFHSPMNSAAVQKVSSHILRGKHEQAAAATAAAAKVEGLAPVTQEGTLFSLYFLSATAAAAGESMTIDVLVNGVSILTGLFTFDSTKAAKAQHELPLDPAKKALAIGDVVTTSRVYVAGGGPTMTDNVVVVQPSA